MFNKVKYRDVIYLKFEDRFFTLGLALKGSINFTIKENLLLYCRRFLVFVVAFII